MNLDVLSSFFLIQDSIKKQKIRIALCNAEVKKTCLGFVFLVFFCSLFCFILSIIFINILFPQPSFILTTYNRRCLGNFWPLCLFKVNQDHFISSYKDTHTQNASISVGWQYWEFAG